jgi:hypothetical protein
MKSASPWVLSVLLVLVSFSALAEESTGERIKEGAVEAGHVIKEDAVKAGRAIKKGAIEVGHAAVKGAQAVKQGALNVKRRVAVARCKDGAYSYTTQNTCNHHGGVKERLK